jgi:hypothetical protein
LFFNGFAKVGADIAMAVIRKRCDSKRMTTMTELCGNPGFAPPRNETARSKRRALELIATLTLTVCLIVAATAVSMGNRLLTRSEVLQHAVVLPAKSVPPAAE